MTVPPLRVGCHAYVSSVSHEPSDHLVHQVKEIGREMVYTTCRRQAIPFDSPLKRYPRVLPTTDALSCMTCMAEAD